MGNPEITEFGHADNGAQVQKITLQNTDLRVSILTWGAILQSVRLTGVDRDLTLGSDDLGDYKGDLRYHGAIVGPIANRISTGRVTLAGMTYELERNMLGRIHLHSGAEGVHRRVWQLVDASPTSATLQVTLDDGLCGLPGNRVITAGFALDGPTLDMTIDGTTDALTLMNFANHSYWNFDGTDTYDGHELWVAADSYLPCTPEDYPTGDVVDVTDTMMDFRKPRQITVHQPPFDNNFCLSDGTTDLRDVLGVKGKSGAGMTIATNQPGIQVYDARNAVRPGRKAHEGLAIEAQGWPDAPNNPHFPQIRVTPDAPYHQHTRFTFFRG